jgi:hypothetical protein
VTSPHVAVLRPPPIGVLMDLCHTIHAHNGEAWAVMPEGEDPYGELEGDWDRVVRAPDNPDVIARLLAGADGVLANEHTVEMADQVAWRLGVPGNDPRTSALRRRKDAMTQALANADLSSPATIRAVTLAEALSAAEAVGWPVVVKPPASCASDGFALCHDAAELTVAWCRAHGRYNLLGEVNDALLVQELLPGGQYTVNTVSVRGADCQPLHVVTDAWVEDRRLLPGAAGMSCNRSDLLFPSDPLFAMLVGYSRRVLDALGIVWGPAHIEVRLNRDDEPCAIDVAARLPGYYPQNLVAEALGLSQADAAVLAVVDPVRLASQPPDYPSPSLAVTQLWMIVPADGLVLDGGALADVAEMPTVRGAFDSRPGLANERLAALAIAGNPIPRTTDLTSAVGGWNLAGPTDLVETAVVAIRNLEKNELYRPRATEAGCVG